MLCIYTRIITTFIPIDGYTRDVRYICFRMWKIENHNYIDYDSRFTGGICAVDSEKRLVPECNHSRLMIIRRGA